MKLDGEELKNGHTEKQVESIQEDNAGREQERELEEALRLSAQDVEVPDSLRPENMDKLLAETADKKKRRSHRRRAWTWAAAACCVCAVGLTAWGIGRKNSAEQMAAVAVSGSVDEDAGQTGDSAAADRGTSSGDAAESTAGSGTSGVNLIAEATDYDQIYDYIEAEAEESSRSTGEWKTADEAVSDSAAASTSSGASYESFSADSGNYSDTNIREDGVGEGDAVKTDGKNLYIANEQRVQIVGIRAGELEELGTIRLEDEQYISEIYVKDEVLLIMYTKSEYNDEYETYKTYTVAETYDVSDPEKPQSAGKVTQSGDFDTMRVNGEYVYLLSNFYVPASVPRKAVSEYIPSVQGKVMESGSILLPEYQRGNQYTIVSTFSLKNPEEKIDSRAIFGCSGLVYVSGENIYVCETDYSPEDADVSQTCIRKVAYADGKLQPVGQTRVDGTLNDSFSIDEYEGNLRLVTTVTAVNDDAGGWIPFFSSESDASAADAGTMREDSNSLYILDENLKEQGRIEGLAEDEQIYSARFIGDTGYFVTYKQVDPLFSVDLSDPANPEVLGELKIPGFSEYLHPYGDGLLLGIGMDVDETGTTTNGVKLSMFDISNPSDVQEIAKHVLEDCYSAEVSYDYRTALIDSEKNLIGFSAYGQGKMYYIFSYSKDDFICLFERELSGYGTARGIYVGDMFYLVAGNTVESYQLSDFTKVDDIVL